MSNSTLQRTGAGDPLRSYSSCSAQLVNKMYSIQCKDAFKVTHRIQNIEHNSELDTLIRNLENENQTFRMQYIK